jgi:hypothetical protein
MQQLNVGECYALPSLHVPPHIYNRFCRFFLAGFFVCCMYAECLYECNNLLIAIAVDTILPYSYVQGMGVQVDRRSSGQVT